MLIQVSYSGRKSTICREVFDICSQFRDSWLQQRQSSNIQGIFKLTDFEDSVEIGLELSHVDGRPLLSVNQHIRSIQDRHFLSEILGGVGVAVDRIFSPENLYDPRTPEESPPDSDCDSE